MNEKRRGETAHIGDILADRNIELVGADAFTRHGFTQVPNPILKSKRISPGAKLAYTALLSYAWNCNYCYPGQQRMGEGHPADGERVHQGARAEGLCGR